MQTINIVHKRTEKQEGGIFSFLSMITAPIATTNEKSQYKMKGIDGKSICCFNKNDPSNIYVITNKGTFMECTFDYKDMNSTTEKIRTTKSFIVS
jgi:hypothetical protein